MPLMAWAAERLFQNEHAEQARRGNSSTIKRLNWLGRLDSNQGMAESKSDQFARNINAHSEKIAKFDPLSVNRLAADSEWRPR
jgi:hypothetical protein